MTGETHFKNLILEKCWNLIPPYCRPADLLYKYSTKQVANKLESMIVDFLNLSGHHAERTKTHGRIIEGETIKRGMYGSVQTKSKYIPGTSTKGSSDIKAVIDGKFIAIEVEHGKDQQSPAQVKYEANIKQSGGEYWIVNNFEDFFQQYENYIKKACMNTV